MPVSGDLADPDHADLIFTGGTIVTVDRDFSMARALAVRNGVIVAVGTEDDVAALRGPDTRVVALDGGAVLPGMNDTHVHGAMLAAYWPRHWIESAESFRAREIPTPRQLDTKEKVHEAIEFTQKLMLSLGITSYTEPGLGAESDHQHGGGVGAAVLQAYLDRAAAGLVTARVNILLNFGELDGPCRAEDFERGLADVPVSADPRRVQIGGVKLFVDGSPAVRRGWMHQPYVGTDEVGGLTMMDGEDDAERLALLRRLIALGHEAGHQVGVHSTGSRSVDEVVHAFVDAMGNGGSNADPRHYIIHGDCASRETLRLMGERHIGFSTQPSIYRMIGGLLEESVGTEAADDAFPLGWAFEEGVRTGISSDGPIVTSDWRIGLVDAILHRGAPGDASRQRISVADAIRGYTINGAWLDHAEDWKGSLEVGKVADLCVLEQNPLDVPVEEIPAIAVAMTVVDGAVVYENGGNGR